MRWSALPEYVAVIECIPRVSADVEIVAFPPASAAVPTEALPSFSVTDPEGASVPGTTEATVIVKITAAPTLDGLGEEVNVVVVAA